MANKIEVYTDDSDNVTHTVVYFKGTKYVEKAIVDNNGRGTFNTTSIVLNSAVQELEDDILTELRAVQSQAEARTNQFVKA